MTLRISEMPYSFTGQALYAAAHSDLIGFHENSPLTWATPVQAVAWIAYDIAVNILVAPAGVVYHSAAALAHKARSFVTRVPETQKKQAALAWEHFKSAATDMAGLGLVFLVSIRLRLETVPYEDFLYYWFSSSNVQIVNPQPQAPHFSSDQIDNVVPLRWGHVDAPHSRQCSYRNLRHRAAGRDLEDPQHAANTLLDDWQEIKKSNDFFSYFWIKRPSVDISFKPPALSEKPSYKIHWKAVAWVVAGIAALAFTAFIGLHVYEWMEIISLVWKTHPMGCLLGTSRAVFVFAACVAGTTALFSWGIKECLTGWGDAQLDTGNHLMNEVAQTPDRNKALRALGWYRKAALNGCTDAQRHLGLGLLNSLPQHNDASTMDLEELRVVKEAIQWLQAAAINKDHHALEDLQLLFNILSHTPYIDNRIYQGVTGNDESERIRNMFPQGHNFLDIAVVRYAQLEADATKRANIQAAFLGQRRQRLIGPVCLEIENAKPVDLGENCAFPDDLGNIIAQYVVG